MYLFTYFGPGATPSSAWGRVELEGRDGTSLLHLPHRRGTHPSWPGGTFRHHVAAPSAHQAAGQTGRSRSQVRSVVHPHGGRRQEGARCQGARAAGSRLRMTGSAMSKPECFTLYLV